MPHAARSLRFARPTVAQALLAVQVSTLLLMLSLLLHSPFAHSAPPAFTGAPAFGSGASSLINLRSQGVITGTGPITVRVDGILVRDRTSPLVSATPQLPLPGVASTVCLLVTKPPGNGIEFSRLGVDLTLTLFNAEAPGGITGTVTIETGSASAGTSPAACADVTIVPPTANAGPDQSIADSDRQAGETIQLNGTASTDTDGRIVSYRWTDSGRDIATGPTASVRLGDGSHALTLIVTDDSGASATDSVNVTVAAPTGGQLPVASAGPDQVIEDTDRQSGEVIALDGSASSDSDGAVVRYEWLLGESTPLAAGPSVNVRLPDGAHAITLRVTDNSGDSATDTVVVTINGASAGTQIATSAGTDRRVADTDNAPGETVALDGGATSSDVIASYQWTVNGDVIAQGAAPSVRLPDGDSLLTLTATDAAGNSASDSVLITVVAAATAQIVASAGPDQALADTDRSDGELVQLDASISRGAIVQYHWLRGGQEFSTGVSTSIRLPDGDHVITLIVDDAQGATASDVVQISIARAANIPTLAGLPGLTPNQRSVAVALDSLCPKLQSQAAFVTADQADLRRRCDAILATGAEQQVRALDELSAQDLNATRTQTFDLSRSQLANLSDRLVALRSGARGMSLTGFNLESGDQVVPLELLVSQGREQRGGGASADTTSADLLDADLGLWLRGNTGFGSKKRGVADAGFDSHQRGFLGGIDYRFSPVNILGIAVGYGQSRADFSPSGSGDLDTSAVTAALYATMYTQAGFYFDAIASYLDARYASDRRINYAEDDAIVDLRALGSTSGGAMSVAATFGYDLIFGGLTIAPTIGYNYMTTRIDGFRERGAAGLDLEYLPQNYVSATANGGLRISYALKTPIGVFIPQIRGEYVREFIRDTESFGVRFANDPFSGTPLIDVTSDVPDNSYARIAGGISAQLKYGVAAFFEYQKMIGQELFTYADMAFGLRLEHSFH